MPKFYTEIVREVWSEDAESCFKIKPNACGLNVEVSYTDTLTHSTICFPPMDPAQALLVADNIILCVSDVRKSQAQDQD